MGGETRCICIRIGLSQHTCVEGDFLSSIVGKTISFFQVNIEYGYGNSTVNRKLKFSLIVSCISQLLLCNKQPQSLSGFLQQIFLFFFIGLWDHCGSAGFGSRLRVGLRSVPLVCSFLPGPSATRGTFFSCQVSWEQEDKPHRTGTLKAPLPRVFH